MLADLIASPGVQERFHAAGPIGAMALHGGIEDMTAEIASEVAAAAGLSLYAVVQPPDLAWHVPSTQYDPDASPNLAGFISAVHTVVSIHGFGRRGMEDTVLLGGSNRPLAERLASYLRAGTGLAVVDDLAAIPEELRGIHPRNPVNLPTDGGVQIELGPATRLDGARRGLIEALTAGLIGELATLGEG